LEIVSHGDMVADLDGDLVIRTIQYLNITSNTKKKEIRFGLNGLGNGLMKILKTFHNQGPATTKYLIGYLRISNK
jgi:hypothetical protein